VNTYVALVTGAGGKLGSQIAITLAQRGFVVALHYNSNKAAVFKTQQAIATFGGSSELFQADFNNLSEVELLIDSVSKVLSAPYLLVNSGSVFYKLNLLESSKEPLQEMMIVNSLAPYLLMKQFALSVKTGLIINMLDQKISLKKTKYLPYTLSKKFLADLTKLAATELSPNIQVNGIAPRYVYDAIDDDVISTVLLEGGESVQDILDAVNYFIDNKDVTGEIIYTAKDG